MSLFSEQTTQQQRKQDETYNREEEYRRAQAAAVESVIVGRSTLEAATRQGEQLRNAEQIADDAEFKLDRASRILRGMTWSGWLANKFTKDVESPEYNTNNVGDGDFDGTGTGTGAVPPKIYENVPNGCERAVQAIQNYSCNLQVLESCEEEEQIATCVLICDQMYSQAKKEVEALHSSNAVDDEAISSATDGEFLAQLSHDLSILRTRQRKSQTNVRRSSTPNHKNATGENKASLFQGATGTKSSSSNSSEAATAKSPIDKIAAQQEDHLAVMSQHLDELSSLAVNLNESLGTHTTTLDSLDEKSESMIYKSKMVVSRS